MRFLSTLIFVMATWPLTTSAETTIAQERQTLMIAIANAEKLTDDEFAALQARWSVHESAAIAERRGKVNGPTPPADLIADVQLAIQLSNIAAQRGGNE